MAHKPCTAEGGAYGQQSSSMGALAVRIMMYPGWHTATRSLPTKNGWGVHRVIAIGNTLAEHHAGLVESIGFGFKVLSVWSRIYGLGLWIGARCIRVLGLGFGVQGLGFGVHGLGWMDWSVGFGV